MIFVFGSVLQIIRIETDKDQTYEQFEFTKLYKNSVGGKAGLQSVAAAKAGGKTAIVSRTGDDELAKHILMRLRKHGVITTAVAKTRESQTGTAIRLDHEHRTIIALGASSKASNEQIPAEILSDRNIVLMQTELPPGENSKLLAKAKAKGAKTIFNISPRFEVESEDIANIDYAIMSMKHKDKWTQLCQSAPQNPSMTTIFIVPNGTVEYVIKGQTKTMPKVQHDKLTWNHPEAYEDVFCGTFAAGLYANLSFENNLLRANIASGLSASRFGGYSSIPYIDEVDRCLREINERD